MKIELDIRDEDLRAILNCGPDVDIDEALIRYLDAREAKGLERTWELGSARGSSPCYGGTPRNES